MKNLSVLIKPASSLCNIECEYCFYNAIAGEREVASYGLMKVEVLDEIVRKALEYTSGGSCTFAFQGGEPTLAGLEFYRELIRLQKKYDNGSQINNAIQTNGILIDEEWAGFLRDNNFLVGLSLDGPQKIHDARRRGRDGRGTYHRVMKAKKAMDKAGVEYNVLTVVDNTVARNIRDVYEFFKGEKIGYTQYIPCLDPLMSAKEGEGGYLSVKVYGTFMKKLFDMWYRDLMKGRYISIRYFDNLINMILGAGVGACDMMGHCSIQNVIEADGSVYPCDFYVYDQWRLGSIEELSFEEMGKSERAGEFLESSLEKSSKCSRCRWANLCRGECRRKRENPQRLNTLCEAYYDFFEYTAERLIEVAMKVRGGEIGRQKRG